MSPSRLRLHLSIAVYHGIKQEEQEVKRRAYLRNEGAVSVTGCVPR